MRSIFSIFVTVAILAAQPLSASENEYTVKATVFENFESQQRVYLMLDRDDLFLYKYSCCPACFGRLVVELERWRENDPVRLAASDCKSCPSSLVVNNLRHKTQVTLDLGEESLCRLPKIERIDSGDLLKILLDNGTQWQVRADKDSFYGSIWMVGDRVVISEDASEEPILINMDQKPSSFSRHPIAWAYGYNLRQLAVLVCLPD